MNYIQKIEKLVEEAMNNYTKAGVGAVGVAGAAGLAHHYGLDADALDYIQSKTGTGQYSDEAQKALQMNPAHLNQVVTEDPAQKALQMRPGALSQVVDDNDPAEITLGSPQRIASSGFQNRMIGGK